MGDMDSWNLVLLAVAAYLAVVTLARLMLRRRNQLMAQFRHEVEKEKGRRNARSENRPRPPRERAA